MNAPSVVPTMLIGMLTKIPERKSATNAAIGLGYARVDKPAKGKNSTE